MKSICFNYLLIVLLFSVIKVIFAQHIQEQIVLSDSLIDFGQVYTNTGQNRLIYLKNNSSKTITIDSAEFEEDEFAVEFENKEIPAFDSIGISVSFCSEQNIDYADFLRISMINYHRPLIARVQAKTIHEDDYYLSTQNQWDEELKRVLHDSIEDHVFLGYNAARDRMYGAIDNVDGYVECVYTGRRAFFYDREGANQNNFNCEHTWPQSFFSENEPMKSDLFHLYPTDVNANSKRGNLDFGKVVSATWSEGGSYLGMDSLGLTVFEPRDTHKGNVARSHFYFIVRYDGNYIEYQNPQTMEETLRNWHGLDPVDDSEIERNKSIYQLQKNRNPFIDHPEFVNRIQSFFSPAHRILEPEMALSPKSVDIRSLNYNQNLTIYLAMINTGGDSLQVEHIHSTNQQFKVGKNYFFLGPESYTYVPIEYTSPAFDTIDSTQIVIESNDEDEILKEVPLKIQVNSAVALQDNALIVPEIQLLQNYPNPFNPITAIRYQLPGFGSGLRYVELNIYNLLGLKIITLVAEKQAPGVYEYEWHAEHVPSGIYFYSLQAESYSKTRRMILLR